jgi:hypothetical protein
MQNEAADTLIEAQGGPKVAVHDAFPVIQILTPECFVEVIGMTGGCDVSGGRAFAEHLQDGIAGDEMNQQEYD